MPAPKKKKDPDSAKESKRDNKGKLQISVAMPSLSSLDPGLSAQVVSEVRSNIYNSINDAELQKALDVWIKDHHSESKIVQRDYNILKSIITEYLDSYMCIGYSSTGERYILHHAKSARDQDAIMEFLKSVFIQQQQSNFLDSNDLDDEDL
jgi:predicted small metal-binding protein